MLVFMCKNQIAVFQEVVHQCCTDTRVLTQMSLSDKGSLTFQPGLGLTAISDC